MIEYLTLGVLNNKVSTFFFYMLKSIHKYVMNLIKGSVKLVQSIEFKMLCELVQKLLWGRSDGCYDYCAFRNLNYCARIT